MRKNCFIHSSAIVSPKASIGRGTKVWAFAQIREDAVIGKDCILGNGVYVDSGVRIGDRVNIHNKALLYRNLVVEDDVFIGPGVCFVNDPSPRANRIRNLKGLKGVVRKGASIGANACILSDVNIGRFAMIGAGSLVSKDVIDYGLVYGVPAKLVGLVSPEGSLLEKIEESKKKVVLKDPHSDFRLIIDRVTYDNIQRLRNRRKI